MDQFEQLVDASYKKLLEIGHLIHWRDSFFTLMWDRLPATVADKETLTQIQINDLFEAVNHTRTAAGAATLYRSLLQPLTSLELVLAKQDALKELESNDKLRNAIINYLEEFKNKSSGRRKSAKYAGEESLYRFLADEVSFIDFYKRFKAASRAATSSAEGIKMVPRPESQYLAALFSSIENFNGTKNQRLMKGPVYRTLTGLRTSEENLYLSFRLWLTNFSWPAAIYGVVALLSPLYISSVNPDLLEKKSNMGNLILLMYSAIISFAYTMKGKIGFDYRTALKPLMKRLNGDARFSSAIDSLGKLDELVSFWELSKSMPMAMAIPEITESDSHYFEAKRLFNPVLGQSIPDYVPNNISLNGDKLTFITGPNSGGKTTITKTIAQAQLMAQIGCYVPAESARMSIADRIFYQYYQPDPLQHSEGDFGINLERTRDIFFAATPQSLVLLNVLASGTTTHEELEQAYGILRDFAKVGGNTIYVTHRYEVAERFQHEGIGQFLKTSYNGDKPTFLFAPGISRESHAARIAERIGFSPEHRRQHLIKQGFVRN